MTLYITPKIKHANSHELFEIVNLDPLIIQPRPEDKTGNSDEELLQKSPLSVDDFLEILDESQKADFKNFLERKKYEIITEILASPLIAETRESLEKNCSWVFVVEKASIN